MHQSQEANHWAGFPAYPTRKISMPCGMGVPPVLKMVKDLSYPTGNLLLSERETVALDTALRDALINLTNPCPRPALEVSSTHGDIAALDHWLTIWGAPASGHIQQ